MKKLLLLTALTFGLNSFGQMFFLNGENEGFEVQAEYNQASDVVLLSISSWQYDESSQCKDQEIELNKDQPVPDENGLWVYCGFLDESTIICAFLTDDDFVDHVSIESENNSLSCTPPSGIYSDAAEESSEQARMRFCLNGNAEGPSFVVQFNDDAGEMTLYYSDPSWTQKGCDCEIQEIEMNGQPYGVEYTGWVSQYSTLKAEVQQGFINNISLECDNGRDCDTDCCHPKAGMYTEVN